MSACRGEDPDAGICWQEGGEGQKSEILLTEYLNVPLLGTKKQDITEDPVVSDKNATTMIGIRLGSTGATQAILDWYSKVMSPQTRRDSKQFFSKFPRFLT